MPGSAGFSAAQGGSFNTNDAENVIYTAKGKRSMDEIRKKTDIKKFRNSQLLSKGMTLRLGIDPTDYSLHKKYLDELSNALEPYVKNQEKTIDKGVGKDTDKLRSLISKLEIATVIKESGQEDEIILDLYNAIKSKSVVNRKDFEKIIGKLSDSIYKQSRAKGQKQLTRQESDVLAKARLITKMGSNYKLPSSFYIKLY
jgi:catalase (peroxidase I)